ncbi:hypothetical protein HYS47_05370, partial [Candidatus Woesearchaeota archaeon]|nr:hypothetical protein [Candidatus Woesearchaeota archaeon]
SLWVIGVVLGFVILGLSLWELSGSDFGAAITGQAERAKLQVTIPKVVDLGDKLKINILIPSVTDSTMKSAQIVDKNNKVVTTVSLCSGNAVYKGTSCKPGSYTINQQIDRSKFKSNQYTLKVMPSAPKSKPLLFSFLVRPHLPPAGIGLATAFGASTHTNVITVNPDMVPTYGTAGLCVATLSNLINNHFYNTISPGAISLENPPITFTSGGVGTTPVPSPPQVKLKIINDLATSNEVVGVMLAPLGEWNTPARENFLCTGTTLETIPVAGQKEFTIPDRYIRTNDYGQNIISYELSIIVGQRVTAASLGFSSSTGWDSFCLNLAELSTGDGVTQDMIDDFYVTCSKQYCGGYIASPHYVYANCPSMPQDSSGEYYEAQKSFEFFVDGHCSGITLVLRLSKLLPDGNSLNAESPMCNLYG